MVKKKVQKKRGKTKRSMTDNLEFMVIKVHEFSIFAFSTAFIHKLDFFLLIVFSFYHNFLLNRHYPNSRALLITCLKQFMKGICGDLIWS